MLEGLYKMVGDEEHRRVAAAHANKLKSMPPEVITATGLFSEGELAASERLIRAFLLRHGDHVEAMRLLARIGVARDILDDAEVLHLGIGDIALSRRLPRHQLQNDVAIFQGQDGAYLAGLHSYHHLF